jgi:hypothetical protein
MNTIPINTVIIVAVLIVVALAAIGWAVMQRRRSLKLRQRFGPEYDRAVNEFGGKTKAEAELTKREQRVARLNMIPITAADAARFSDAWSALQGPLRRQP